MEAWEKSLRTLSKSETLQAYEASWESEVAKAWAQEPNPEAWQKSGMKKTEKDLADRRVRGRDQLLTYLENSAKERLRPWTLPDTGLPAVEVAFEEDFGGIPVKGFIDLVLEDMDTGALLVRDVKTGAKKPVGRFQLDTYRLALRKKYGVTADWGDYWMCKDEGPSSPEYLGSTPEVLISSQYQIVDEAINLELWGANIGEHCGRCDVAKHCPFVGGEAPSGVSMLGT